MLKMIRNTLLAASAVALMAPSASMAEEGDFGKIYTECGLGGMIGSAADDQTTSKVLAIITNVTWDLGTTASTSYYSSEDTCMNKKVRVAAFINESFEKLEKDIANGDGKYLDALTSLALDGTASKTDYTSKLRSEFSKVVTDEGYTSLSRYDKVKKLYEIAI